MKVTIVGGNSQVGTELCFLYRAGGHTVRPVVRSERGAWFLEHHGFDCRFVDFSTTDEAESTLRGSDLVIIAAFASQTNRRGFRPREARRANEAIVRNTVQQAPASATVVYLSTIHAFGESVGPSRWTWYGIEKRNAESVLLSAAERHETSVYPIRLGQVFGVNQGKTKKIVEPITTGRFDRVNVEPERPSNIVHTVSIVDATYELMNSSEYKERTYTVVNSPQWTWQDVYEHYLSNFTEIEYLETVDSTGSTWNHLLKTGFQVARPHAMVLRSLLLYLPQSINTRISQYSRRNSNMASIVEIQNRGTFGTHEFTYDPAPGPFLDIPDTRTRLGVYDSIAPLLQEDGRNDR